MAYSAGGFHQHAESDCDDLYRTIADTAPALLWLTDANNVTTYFNATWLEYTGRTLAEEIGFGWWNAIHDDDREATFAAFEKHVSQQEPFSLEYRLKRHDGEYRWLRDTGRPRFAADGVFAGYVGSCIDINDYKELEQAREESEAFARATVDALSAHIAIIDETGVIIAVNQAWRDFASNNPPARSNVFEGANYLTVCERTTGPDAVNARAFARGIRAVLMDETPEFSLEYPCHAPWEQRWFNARVTRFDTNGRRRVVISHENITKRKLLEDSTAEQNEIIETVNRIGLALGAELDLSRLLQTVTNAAAEVTHAQFGVFFYNLGDGSHPDERFTTVSTSVSETERLATLRLTPLFDQIMTSVGVVRSSDLLRDNRFSAPLSGHELDLPVKSLLAVPVRSRAGDLLGGLFLGHTRPGMFDLRHEKLAVGLAAQASIALDNARLYDETRRQAKHYEVTLASIGDAVIATDQHGRVTFINAVAEKLTGWGDDGLGLPLQTVFEVVSEDSHLPIENPFDKVMRTGLIVGMADHTTLIARHGDHIAIDDSGAPIRNDNGDIIGVVLVFRDVSERKKIEERLRFLADVNLALTSSLDANISLQALTARVVPALADWCSIHVVEDDGGVRTIAETHSDSRTLDIVNILRQRYPSNNVFGFRRTIKTRQPVFVSRVDMPTLAAAAKDDEHLSLLASIGMTSHLCVPIMSARGCVATLTLATAQSGRVLDESSVLLAEELAQRVSMAIENARLYTTERQARQEAEHATARISLLQSVTAALSEAVTPSQVAGVIVEQSLNALGGQFGKVALLSQDGAWLENTGASGDTTQPAALLVRTSVDANFPLNTAVRLGQPVWIESSDDAWQHFPTGGQARTAEHVASANLPLVANGHVIGGMSIEFPAGTRFSAEERAFLQSLAQQCAQAVQRALLFADEQLARHEAERANALKMKFLAMISHELRTPLTSIKGFVTTLLADDVAFSPEDQRAFLSIVDEESDKLAELVDQLMDLSRLQAGTLGIRPERQALSAVLARAMTQLQTLTPHHRLAIDVPESLPRVIADAQRIAQVLVNLVGNAVKYAPPDSEIAIRARATGDWVQVDVSDQGPGIPPEARNYVFEAFRQVSDNSPWPKKGAGLGLAICQGLVEAHGGTIWIHDTVTDGTTVSFTLPVIPPASGLD